MTACCVLIDVTTRCDQRCPWCFARAGDEAAEPSLEEIGRWYDRLIELGEERPFNIQISGGEPAVRDDLPAIVALGRGKGFTYIQLNTNGRRLGALPPSDGPGGRGGGEGDRAEYGGGAVGEAYARQLAEAGLTTVFMQFDGISDAVYEKLRGEPLLDIKLRAIENCGKAGLPVTLVPTVVKGVNIFERPDRSGEIGGMIEFMLANLGTVKGIHFQPASFFGRHPEPSPETGRRGADSAGPGDANRIEVNSDRVTMFAVMNEIERQTGGRIRGADLLPITTGHPLCCFCANFLRETDGSLTSLATDKQREEGMACCDEATAGAVRGEHDAGSDSCCSAPAADTDADPCCCAPAADATAEAQIDASCCRPPDPLDIIRRDRDFVLNKWRSPSGKNVAAPADGHTLSLDEALDWLCGNMFTLSGMAFMDASNLDAERLKRCRVQYYTGDDRLIPFCAYNTIYR
jgi:uncharacterized radical SAM superfamily Fe-S cluster-containing enzyme